MKKEYIKQRLKTHSIYSERSSSISNVFASSIAPSDTYDEALMNEALVYLGQNPHEDLKCVFCKNEAAIWNHLVSLVKDGELRGYGHQIGNLVPCCKQCSEKKSGKEFKKFINEYDKVDGNKNDLIALLSNYQKKFAKEVKLELLEQRYPSEYKKFKEIKQKIFNLMKEADELADKLRANILE